MIRKITLFYWILIAAALICSLYSLDRQIERAHQTAIEAEKLSRAVTRLDSLAIAASYFTNDDFAEKESVEAQIAKLKSDSEQLASEVRGFYDKALTASRGAMGEAAAQSFASDLAEILGKLKRSLSDMRDQYKRDSFRIFLAGAAGFCAVFLIWGLRLYIETRVGAKRLEAVAEHIDRFTKYITDASNEFERLPIARGETGLITRRINDAADRYEKRRDENIKTLGELLLISEQVGKGRTSNRILSESSNYLNSALVEVFNKMAKSIDLAIGKTLFALEAYQKGDYSAQIDAGGLGGEMKLLIDGVNALGMTLSESAAMNLNYGMTLNDASKGLTDAVSSLTKVSTSQAQSVDKITAGVREIIQKIQETTLKAERMAALAIETKEAATSGLSLTQDTVKAMEEINASTSQIKEAIAVIDTISFQTNILSLNAAVEAATAGEAGKGFAVVAGEVRTLAGKSAEAAKKIKELVAQTQSKANEGMSISKKMIGGFDILSGKVADTYELVSAVTVASQEEMKKAGSINKSIEELGAINRQNSEAANQTGVFTTQVLSLADRLVRAAKNKRLAAK